MLQNIFKRSWLKGPWFETLLLTLVSVLLYNIGIGFLLFLIPLQVIFIRRGDSFFITAMVICFSLILFYKLFILSVNSAFAAAGPFMLIEFFSITLLFGGLVFLNLVKLPAVSSVLKLLAAAAAVWILSIPLILFLRGNEGFNTVIREYFANIALFLNTNLSASESINISYNQPGIDVESLLIITREFFLRSYIFDYFVLLLFSWRSGTILGSKSLRVKANTTGLKSFRMPDAYIWPLILGLAGVLVNNFRSLEFLGFLVWNTALIMLFLFALTGFGIIRFLFEKFRLARPLRFLFAFSLVILIMTPRLGIVFLLLIPALGVSEIWIKYRIKQRSED
ncbi:hypothetical protein ES705_31133 [subsurface metagenome]